MMRRMSLLHQNLGDIGKSIPSAPEISLDPRASQSGMDFPKPPSFWWSTDTVLVRTTSLCQSSLSLLLLLLLLSAATGCYCRTCSDPHLLCRFPALTKSEPVSCVALSTCKAEPASLPHLHYSCLLLCRTTSHGKLDCLLCCCCVYVSDKELKWMRRPGNQSNLGLPSALAS